jgi:transcriptional regulator with XRE-family HTH domain
LKRLRHIRERAGYSQQALADESGVGQHTISEVELGRRKPHGRTLRKLASVLGVKVADFYDDDPEPPKGRGRRTAALDGGGRRGTAIASAARGLEAIVEPVEAKLDAGTFNDQDRRDLDLVAAVTCPLLRVALGAEAGYLRERYPDVYDVGPYATLGPVLARFLQAIIDADASGAAEELVRDLDRQRRTVYLVAA